MEIDLYGWWMKHYNDQDAMLHIKKFTHDACVGLAYLAQQKVVHRDIKPENILLDAHGRAKIADFGFARSTDTASGRIRSSALGTPAYIAPELLLRQPYDEKVDVFSMGATIFGLSTGHGLFNDDPSHEDPRLYVRKMAADIKRNLDLIDDPDLKSLLTGMLNMDPERRSDIRQVISHPWFLFEQSSTVTDQITIPTLTAETVSKTPASCDSWDTLCLQSMLMY